jgi:hypothetical protein
MAAEVSTPRPSLSAAMRSDNDRDQIFSGVKKIDSLHSEKYSEEPYQSLKVSASKSVEASTR